MISMIQAVTKLCIVVAALAAFVTTTPSYADGVAYVSNTGNGTSCTASQPCSSIVSAVVALNGVGRVVCVNALTDAEDNLLNNFSEFNNLTIQIDCPEGVFGEMFFDGSTVTVWIRNLTFKNFGTLFAGVIARGSGSLILENCIIDGYPLASIYGAALSVTPNGPFNLVVKNSRISNSIAGVFLKPAAGGSIHATFDHVTIANNAGGGIRIDTTNGPVTLDIADSVIGDNGGNGINALGNAGGQAIVSIKNSVIAKNGGAGVQANGANAGVLIGTTLLDQNTVGATSVVSGGNMFSYGDNRIVGPIGSGFNQTAQLH